MFCECLLNDGDALGERRVEEERNKKKKRKRKKIINCISQC